MDEISPIGPTQVIEIRDETTREWVIDPGDYDYADIGAGELAGALPADNAAVIEAVLTGRGRRGARAAVVLNAGAAIYVAGLAASYTEGVALAEKAIDSGAGLAALERLRAATRG
jgi:anthranilate phosphoribosyltransferase